MLLYAWLNWLNGGDVFFVLLELMVVMASLFMLLGLSEKLSAIFISVLGLIFVSWSVWVFKNSQALFFILGLGLISVGYVLKSGSKKRQAALLSGSLLIAFFSFLGKEWIFFWLNLIFAVFSGYYLYMLSSRD